MVSHTNSGSYLLIPDYTVFRHHDRLQMPNEPEPYKSHVHELGKVTVFYIPSHKLDDSRFFDGTQTARSAAHDFLMDRYKAYTQSPTPVKGYWLNHQNQLVHDVMERFEVSFGSEIEFDRLIKFLIGFCHRLDEDAIYVTRGERSFLVQRTTLESGDSF